MEINAQLQSGTTLKRVAALNTQSMVEVKFSGQEMGEIVALYPQVSLGGCEVSSGRVNYNGRLVCTVVYIDDGGKLCRLQKGAEFSHYIDDDNLAPAQRAQCVLKCQRSKIRHEGSSVVAAVVVSAEVTLYDNAQRSFVTDVDGAICNKSSDILYSAVNFSGEGEVEDDFDCVASDVLVPASSAHVTACNLKTGAVEVEGEIYLSLLAVRDNAPVCLDRIIPFKCEVACDDAILSRSAYCRAEIESANVNCKVNEDSGKCDVTFNATLSFTGHFFEEEEASFVCDAFAEDCNLKLESATECVLLDTDVKNYTERVQGACAAKAKLDYTCAFLAAALPTAEYERTKSGIDGAVTATLLYEQGGEVRATEVSLPFSIALAGLSENCANVSVAVLGMSLRQRSEGECEGEAVLKISAVDGEKKCVTYLTGATAGEPKKCSDAAISVYVTEAGDGLWETAKKLNCPPETIEKSNPELTFPLSGKERIVIFRAKN